MYDQQACHHDLRAHAAVRDAYRNLGSREASRVDVEIGVVSLLLQLRKRTILLGSATQLLDMQPR